MESQDDDYGNEQTAERTKKIRDTLATIVIPYKGENEPMIFSYHYKYEKYLRENNLIDVS